LPTSGSYLIDSTEMNRWGIKNNATDAENTTIGINNALIWASQQGYTEVVLMKGTYLIDERNPIKPQSFMTLNLNGATFKVRPNGLQGYAIVKFDLNQQFSRLTNGVIQGDRDTHNYASGGTHEGGAGVFVYGNAKFITIDNLDIFNCTGDSIITGTTFGLIYENFGGTFELGGISTTAGTLINANNRIRSSYKINMSTALISKWGYFGLYGNGYGGLGAGVTTEFYDLIFYNKDDTFNSSKTNVQFFDEVEVPTGANYAKIVLHQSTLPTATNCTINLRTDEIPEHIYVEKCNLHHCRRQGLSLQGKHQYIRDNEIHHIGGMTQSTGTDPQGGIDIEDGYDQNQYFFIDGNNFHNNVGYDIVVTNGKYINITRNRIEAVGKYASMAINEPVNKAIISNNTFRKAGVMLAGEIIFSNNQIYASNFGISGNGTEILVSSCVFQNSLLSVAAKTPYTVRIENCNFLNDIEKLNSFNNYISTLNLDQQPQTFSNCVFEGVDISYVNAVQSNVQGGWIFENITYSNTKTPAFPPGNYTGCKFIESGTIGTNSGSKGEFNFVDCDFTNLIWNNGYVNLFTVGLTPAFRLINCRIRQSDGLSVNIDNVAGEVTLRGNRFSYENSKFSNQIINIKNTFTGKLIILEENVFSASNSRIGIDTFSTSGLSAQIILRNNVLLDNVTLKLGGREILFNNVINGVTDPYNYMNNEPNFGYYNLAQKAYKSNPVPNSYEGWICVTAGFASDQGWTASKNYLIGNRIYSGSYVYEALSNGTSGATSPIFPITLGATVIDNNITWKVIGKRAVFKPFGNIQG
jgi:hypothetical protein